MQAIRIHAHGGPEQLRWEEVPIAPPGPGEARVRHTAIALNFSDVNVRRGGFYRPEPLPMPLIPGNEAAGVVTALGPGVTAVKPGDRVGYVGTGGAFYENTGAYAEERNLPAERLVPIPDGISDEQAAAVMMKGLTAAGIIDRIFTPQPGDPVLIHAAASGVGLLLTSWAHHLGATVIGTVGSPDKARIAAEHGCAVPILYRETDFVAAVRAVVPEGVAAVFDGVGKDTFIPSLDCTRPFGMLVNYGNASGHVPPLDLLLLAQKGSLSVCRPGVHYYLGHPERFRGVVGRVFDLVAAGAIRPRIGQRWPLRDAAEAHRALEAGGTAGSSVLLP
ncbi:quinone oxidoreductase family protein [Roseomonas sp. BN140053]|uniref:quinone oxidoreductase family protein n=1 Tax=Roseomonas sp. BN140053 TaxID=3391898 RepID=UPI0039E86144